MKRIKNILFWFGLSAIPCCSGFIPDSDLKDIHNIPAIYRKQNKYTHTHIKYTEFIHRANHERKPKAQAKKVDVKVTWLGYKLQV